MSLEDLESKLEESLKTKLYSRYSVNDEDFEGYVQKYGHDSAIFQELKGHKSGVDYYLSLIEFPQEQVDLIRKLINLREVDNNIKSITLDTEDKQHIGLLRNTNPYVSTEQGQFVGKHQQYVHMEFWLYKQFLGLDKLDGYIKTHGLPATKVRVGRDLDEAVMIYSLYHGGVECLFRDSHLLISKDKPVEKVLVYCDGGNIVLD